MCVVLAFAKQVMVRASIVEWDSEGGCLFGRGGRSTTWCDGTLRRCLYPVGRYQPAGFELQAWTSFHYNYVFVVLLSGPCLSLLSFCYSFPLRWTVSRCRLLASVDRQRNNQQLSCKMFFPPETTTGRPVPPLTSRTPWVFERLYEENKKLRRQAVRNKTTTLLDNIYVVNYTYFIYHFVCFYLFVSLFLGLSQ